MAYTYEHPRPSVTVDMVIFTVDRGELRVLLIARQSAPFKGAWALPGGFVDVGDGEPGESLLDAAFRELDEETNLGRGDVYLEQLYTFGDPGRDPRGRVISVAYYALVSSHLLPKVKAGDDAAEARWFGAEEALERPLAFDHREILAMALERLRGKIDYAPQVAVGLVPDEFTQAELRRVYEVVKGVKYDRGNFSKRFRRLIADGAIREVGGSRLPPGAGRPAKLYALVGP
jgi:8-oxo-dGTP diphosphatase